MKPAYPHSFRSILFLMFGIAAIFCLPSTYAVPPKTRSPKAGDAQARRMTIVRTGYAKARPDRATIDLPFKVEGDNWDDVEKKRDAFIQSLEKIVAPFDTQGHAVNVTSAQSGQTYHDGQKFTTDEGRIQVAVRDLTHLSEVFTQIKKQTGAPLMLAYHVTDVALLTKARQQAQVNAITEARRQADLLAIAAGTKIIGIWELNEGEVKILDPAPADPRKPDSLPVPAEVWAASAQITIVFEMAPPSSDKPTQQRKRQATPGSKGPTPGEEKSRE